MKKITTYTTALESADAVELMRMVRDWVAETQAQALDMGKYHIVKLLDMQVTTHMATPSEERMICFVIVTIVVDETIDYDRQITELFEKERYE